MKKYIKPTMKLLEIESERVQWLVMSSNSHIQYI